MFQSISNKGNQSASRTIGLIVALFATFLIISGVSAFAQPIVATGKSQPADTQYFQDVAPGSFYYTATAALYQQLVVSGYPCGTPPAGACVPPSNLPYYLPGNTVTRGQMSFYVQSARSQPGMVMNNAFTSNGAIEISLTSYSSNLPALQINAGGIGTQGIAVNSTYAAAISAGSSGAEAITASSTAAGSAAIKGFAQGSGPGIQGQGTTGSGLDGVSDSGDGVTAISVNADGGAFDTYTPANHYAIKAQDGGVWLTGNNASLLVDQNAHIVGNLVVGGSKTGYVVDIMRNDSTSDLHPGEVVSASGNAASAAQIGAIPVASVVASTRAYDSGVFGVVDQHWIPGDATAAVGSKAREGHYETNTTAIHPGQYMSVVTLGAYKAVNVDTTNGSIHAGDLLTTSATPGVAMRVGDKDKLNAFGAVIGKAMGNLDNGSGLIPVMVTLK